LLSAAESGRLARAMQGAGEVVVIGVAHGRLGLRRHAAELELPCMPGSGEDGARALMRRVLGTSEGELRLLGTAPPAYPRPPLEVWLARRLPRSLGAGGGGGGGGEHTSLQWFAPAEVVTLVGSPVLRSSRTLAALTVAARSDLVPEWSGAAFTARPEPSLDDEAAVRVTLSELRVPTLPAAALDAHRPAPEQFINAELSWLEFNARVLALAERPDTPLKARLRFLAIFSTNLDQFFMVDVGGLKYAVAAGRTRPSIDGLAPQETLDAIAIRLRPLLGRQAACFAALRAGPLADHGVRLLGWAALSTDDQAALRARFAAEIQPLLTPKALTRAPGHPFPFIADRRLSLALVLRDRPGSPVHYAHLELPDRLPRFVPGDDGLRFVPLEDVVRANLDRVFPGRTVVEAHLFRITRSGDIQLDEAAASSFVHAVEEEVRRRPFGPVVRIEVERSMPAALRDLLQREFRFEESDQRSALAGTDVYQAPDLVDLGAVHQLAALPLTGSEYPPFRPAEPFDPDRPVLDQLDRGDVLVHHPYDSFAATFERFVSEAADDPDVTGIKLTLYRPGGRSAIGDALRRAAASGKDVSVCIELKARFDETANIQWARSLERDGIHVVTGLVALKTHAKLALVVRYRDGRIRRYAHVGTGNYNRETAAVYSDLGLFTADDAVAGEVHALFNELTGSSQAPEGRFGRLLVAPNYLLRAFLDMVEREAEHARAGRPARIRAKLNGIADAAVIGALYRASQAGVDVDLVVRGICMLRPGVPGLSDRIRVVSVLGRFLEHARVYYFANGGAPEYYIGSADWRPRNLRRRVEVVVPVADPRARRRLDGILETELADPTAWELGADGTYARRAPGPGEDPRGAQERLLDIPSSPEGAVP
ncbi:MAG: polyphosphate kinase 1, partial [Gemmatimonadales bacterium]